jgi:hypothetical protein
MVPKIQNRGQSFAGLATYLTHDPEQATAKRVAWTHTLNLAHDHVPSAVDEMLWTARATELLKQEAGIRAGGRTTDKPVKHFSLNWSPDDDPSQEHMIAATEDFLRHMKWQDHQALLVAHADKAYAHVHVMLNAIHPETGLALNEDFERRRAQAWALGYEKTQGRIYCEQRLLDADEREDAPTRPAWLAFKEKQLEFTAQERAIREGAENTGEENDNSGNPNPDAWKKLKEIQRHERQAFFAEGKMQFSELRRSIYQEVREEFRERWSDYYAAEKDGLDAAALTDLKKQLVADQRERLEARRDEACAELRLSRDGDYRGLLDDQRVIRHQMHARQDAGLDNDLFLRFVDERDPGKDRQPPSIREAADEITRPEARAEEADIPAAGWSRNHTPGMKSETDIGANIATGLGFGFLSLLGGLADGLVGSTPAPKARQADPEPQAKSDPFEAAIAQGRERQRNEQEEADREWRKRQRSYGE